MALNDELKLWISNEFNKHFETVATRDQLDGVMTAVENNTSGIKTNNTLLASQQREIEGLRGSLRALESEMNDHRRGFDQRVKRLIQVSSAPAGASAGTAGVALTAEEERKNQKSTLEEALFEKSRRSLRIWPINGSNEEEMLAEVKKFCFEALLLCPSMELGITSIERARSSPRGRPFSEVIAVFEDNFARDRVFACGPKLSNYRDHEGKPTCGIRLQIPGHLMVQFRALESYAFNQRSRHEKGEIKKHIKFDESTKGLYMQIKHTKDDGWLDISYAVAKAEMEKNNEKRAKRSFMFKPASKPKSLTDGQNSPTPGTSASASTSKATATATSGAYTPLPRPDATETNNSRQDWRPSRNRSSEMDTE